MNKLSNFLKDSSLKFSNYIFFGNCAYYKIIIYYFLDIKYIKNHTNDFILLN